MGSSKKARVTELDPVQKGEQGSELSGGSKRRTEKSESILFKCSQHNKGVEQRTISIEMKQVRERQNL